MKERLTNNLGLKILAVVLAIFMWLIMVTVSNPLMTETRTVAVEMVNENILEKSNLTYELQGKNTVTVSYEVRVRDQYRITASDFYAYADLSQLYDVTGSIPVQVEIANDSVRSLIEGTPTVKPGVVQIKTEPLQRKRFDLRPHTVGTEQEGYALGQVTLNPGYVYVTGAVSDVGQISSAGVELKIDGINSDQDGSARVKFYDANDNELNLGAEVKLNIEEVDYHVTILNVKNLALDFQVSGEVEDGYRFTGVECNVKSVSVEGLKAALASVNTLTIPDSLLNVDGATGDIQVEVDLTEILPDNITMANDSATAAVVTLKVEPLTVKEVEHNLADVRFEGGRENYSYYFEYDSVTLQIRGLAEDLDRIRADDITLTMDVAGMGAGIYPARFTVFLRDGFELVGQSPVMIHVEDLNAESEESDTSAEDADSGQDSHGSGAGGEKETE